MNILLRDADLVVVDKPSGLLVHRGWANDRDVLMTRVRDALGEYVYPIHRLDRGTSGVVVFALNKQAARRLSEQWARHTVRRRYIALVRGVPKRDGVIDHPVPKSEGGERISAVTELRTLHTFGRYSVVEARPRTGRLHQIRRHLKHISCPIIGDVRYGKGEHNRLFRERYGLYRLALHAVSVELEHPSTGAAVAVQAPIPVGLLAPLQMLAAEAGVQPFGQEQLLGV